MIRYLGRTSHVLGLSDWDTQTETIVDVVVVESAKRCMYGRRGGRGSRSLLTLTPDIKVYVCVCVCVAHLFILLSVLCWRLYLSLICLNSVSTLLTLLDDWLAHEFFTCCLISACLIVAFPRCLSSRYCYFHVVHDCMCCWLFLLCVLCFWLSLMHNTAVSALRSWSEGLPGCVEVRRPREKLDDKVFIWWSKQLTGGESIDVLLCTLLLLFVCFCGLR